MTYQLPALFDSLNSEDQIGPVDKEAFYEHKNTVEFL